MSVPTCGDLRRMHAESLASITELVQDSDTLLSSLVIPKIENPLVNAIRNFHIFLTISYTNETE